MTQTTLTYDTFVQALTGLAEQGLPHGILPWTAFPEDAIPPRAITRPMWDGYTWNPPQFAAAADAGLYGAPDPEAAAKPAWAALVAEARRLDHAEARRLKQAELAEELARHTTFRHAGRLWQGDPESAADITTAALRAGQAGNWPKDHVWIDAANARIPMTAADITALAAALAAWRTARRLRARALKDAILATRTAEQINAIDVTVGWPDESDAE